MRTPDSCYVVKANHLANLQAQQTVLLPTFYSEDTPASANETWARLHSDPLFAVGLLHCV